MGLQTEFRLLGPLEVREGDRLLPLGGRKQRALLALLLLHANEVVSADRLIDELWGEHPPETVATMLHVYVSRLRKLLGAERIATRPPGYLLRVEPGELDLERFERLAADGKDALSGSDAAGAAARLLEALALWRGPVLADLAYEPFAQGAIARLEERRLAAIEDKFDAELAIGRHAELIGELEELIAAQPLRERLRAQLMLALYRSRRQAEALEAYQQTRRTLVEELGIDPSPELQQLEKAILNQDPSLDLPTKTLAEKSVSAEPPMRLAAEERKLVTVLFAELLGSAEPDPERARAVLERFHAAVGAEIEDAGGKVEERAGEAVTAAFGAPAAQEDHAERALHAALALRRRIEDLFEGRLSVRLGVETGEAIVRNDSVTSEAVRIAARLGRAGASGDVFVGERTSVAARGAFEFASLETVEPADRQEKVAFRRLLRGISLARPRGIAGMGQTFVGRESELELLHATYRRVVDEGEPHLVTIMGEAGVGKTRLVGELWQRLGDEPVEPLRRTGRCLSYGKGITYWPLGEVLKQGLGLLESDSPETVRHRLGAREILGLALGLDVAPDLHPLAARDELQAAWVELFDELVTERPAVVVVEDLHWAEDPLLELLERLLRDVRGPLLFIVTARPELLDRRPSWGGRRRNAATIWLEPLRAEEAERLLDELVPGELPEPLRGLVLARAEGNPFFVEEILSTLIDQGLLEQVGGRWAVGELPAGFAVPDSVQAVLASRIDLLPAREKRALQAASVIGRVFWHGPVVELLEGAEPDFVLLEERDFVRRRSDSTIAGEREFAIKHALTREVAYAGLPKGKRARLHAAFAAWLESAGEGRDEHAPFLAHHYAEAVRPDDADLAWADDENELARLSQRAVRWLRRAADLAVARYAIDEAVALLEQALALEKDAEPQSELWRAIGRANALRYDGEAFWSSMQTAIDLTSGSREKAQLYSELALETLANPGMWTRSPESGKSATWIERALELSEPGSPARAGALIARAFSDPPRGVDPALEAYRIAEQLGSLKLRLRAWRAHAEALLALERYAEVYASVREPLGELDEIADPALREGVLWIAVLASVGTGRIEEARTYSELLDELCSRLTVHHAVHGVGVRLMVEELAGGWSTARALTEEGEQRVAANLGTPCAFAVRSLLVCAAACGTLGDEDEARRLERRADALGMKGYGLTTDAPRVRLALLRGDLAAVKRLVAGPLKTMGLARVASVAARLDGLAAVGDRRRVEEEAPLLLQPGTYLEPFALRALGVVREEAELLEKAAAAFDSLGLDWHGAQLPRLLGR